MDNDVDVYWSGFSIFFLRIGVNVDLWIHEIKGYM